MSKSILTRRMAHLMFVVAGAFVGAVLITANNSAHAQPVDEVTVTAPRMVQPKVERSRATVGAATTERVSLTRMVSYADLDLTKTADVSELEKRVNSTASDMCSELDALYPLEKPNRGCSKMAVNDAMKQVKSAIAAAHK